MYIDQLGIWVKDLERMKDFYEKYFLSQAVAKVHNPTEDIHSYLLAFPKGPRLELKQQTSTAENLNNSQQVYLGMIQFSISVGSEEKVKGLTEWLRKDGYTVVAEPKSSGSGNFESEVFDPENN
ncbi:UNVERIFIED_CONTAM: hypothetical protein GTU68_050957, partial [Idotea baltica]|nr:hypothetical protein [Idotea baltica]